MGEVAIVAAGVLPMAVKLRNLDLRFERTAVATAVRLAENKF
jgi:hypothetical protein